MPDDKPTPEPEKPNSPAQPERPSPPESPKEPADVRPAPNKDPEIIGNSRDPKPREGMVDLTEKRKK